MLMTTLQFGLPLAIILIIVLAINWVRAELANKHVSYRLWFGSGTILIVGATLFALWKLESAWVSFYAYHNFEMVIVAAEQGIKQGKAEQVQALFENFHREGSSPRNFQAVQELQLSLSALVATNPEKPPTTVD